MTIKSLLLACATALSCLAPLSAAAQVEPSMYGDKVKADIKVNYVRSLDEALARAKAEKKPIFFNCYADWAIPCHGMDPQELCAFLYGREQTSECRYR